MTKKTALEIRGLEYDWLGCDADDHVALFSTAGGGYAPEEFLEDTDLHDSTIELIVKLPANSAFVFASIDSGGRWRAVAERGLFVFDSDFHGGPYKKVAKPRTPIRLAQLPSEI